MSSRARARPTRRTRRCVPPKPGMSPRLISGCPRRARSAATSRSQASASSRPPPSATPLRAPITGSASASTAAIASCPRREKAAPSSGAIAAIAAMSAPAENARSPAPVSTRARSPGSPSSSRNAPRSARSVAASSAFSAAGRSSVSVATPSCRSSFKLAKSIASVLRPTIEAMMRLDETDGAGPRAHDDRVGDCPTLHVPDPGEVVSGRDPRRGEHHGARRQLPELVLPLKVEDAELAERAGLVLVPWPEPRLHLAAEADERGGSENALRRATGPHEDVDPRVGPGGGERRGDVAAVDQLDARAGFPHLLDEGVVPGAVEDRDREVLDVHALRLGERPQVGGRASIDVDRTAPLRPARDLFHVGVGHTEKRPVLGDRDAGEGVVAARGTDRGALEVVERHVGGRALSGADTLT